MAREFPEPGRDLGDRTQVLLGYLDYYRETVAVKVDGLSDADLTRSGLPSGWSPLELVKHLVFMERRWLVWGFLAQPLTDPWGDCDASGSWRLAPGDSVGGLLDALAAGGRRTREIVEAASLSDRSEYGGRFTADTLAPELERILLHVMHEYARHLGHLDIVRELVDGRTGE